MNRTNSSKRLINVEKSMQITLNSSKFMDITKFMRTTLPSGILMDIPKPIQTTLLSNKLMDIVKSMQTTLPSSILMDIPKSIQTTLPSDVLMDIAKSVRTTLPSSLFIDLIENTQTIEKIRASFKNQYSHKDLFDLCENLSSQKWTESLSKNLDITISNGNTLIIDSKHINKEEIKSITQKIIDESITNLDNSLLNFTNRIIDAVNSLKDSNLQILITSLVYPIIIGLLMSVISPINDHYLKEYLKNRDKRQVIKSASEPVKYASDKNTDLNQFKIVTVSTLNIRKSGSKKSSIIGCLHLGDVVKVTKKGRDWSLIIWSDSETLVSGWVFSRYLKSVK